eukprot:13768694-Heterocapsa_arctica.AAC.1
MCSGLRSRPRVARRGRAGHREGGARGGSTASPDELLPDLWRSLAAALGSMVEDQEEPQA